MQVGSAASGKGDGREIPVEEGGDVGRDGRFVVLLHCFLCFVFPLFVVSGVSEEGKREKRGKKVG